MEQGSINNLLRVITAFCDSPVPSLFGGTVNVFIGYITGSDQEAASLIFPAKTMPSVGIQ